MKNASKSLILNYPLWCVILLCFTACKQDSKNGIPAKCDKDKIKSTYLLTAAEAKKVLDGEDDIIPIYVCEKDKFESEHIPNSLNIWRPQFRSQVESEVKGMRCSKLELEHLLSELGVEDSSTLLLYDNKGSVDAIRFGWVLEYYGFKNFKVINGGLTSWKRADFPIVSGAAKERPTTTYRINSNQENALLATLEDVKSAIKDSSTIIVDTRELYEYLGQPFKSGGEVYKHKNGAFAAGAIPTAVHLNWSVLSDLGDDHRIKCEKDLRYDLNNLGITPDKKVIVYCQSGSRSSHTSFVLRHVLGYPDVKNYDGSWIEWSHEYVTNGDVEIELKTDSTTINEMFTQMMGEI